MNENADRQAFELWASMPPREWRIDRLPKGSFVFSWPFSTEQEQYCVQYVQSAWEAFKFGRESESEALHEYAARTKALDELTRLGQEMGEYD